MKQPAVYILSSGRNGTLYVGVTSDLPRRIWQHRTHETGGFTARHGVTRLVYFERHDEMPDAVLREKRIKKWRRAWKVQLIETANPEWRDLFDTIIPSAGPPLSRG